MTLLFTDIEGSTRLLDRLGAERYSEVLDLHRGLLRDAFEREENLMGERLRSGDDVHDASLCEP